MKNCKNCGSNDRIDVGEYRICSYCGTRTLLVKKIGHNSPEIMPLIESFEIKKRVHESRFIRFDDLTVMSPSHSSGSGQRCVIYTVPNDRVKKGTTITTEKGVYCYVVEVKGNEIVVLPMLGDITLHFMSGEKIKLMNIIN